MAYTNKYGGYRGRGNGRKVFLAVILIAIIVFCMGYLVLDGAITLPELPSMQAQVPTQTEPDLDITISPAQDPTPAPAPEPVFETNGILLTTDVSSWSAVDLSVLNTVALPIKLNDGKVYYPSALSEVSLGANAPTLEDLAPFLTDSFHTVAQVNPLEDQSYALSHVEGAGLKNTGGFIFYDGYGKNWLDPAKEGTQDYLIAIALELYDLGFDEIMLTNLTYPTYGKVDKIAPTADPASQGLKQLVAALYQALADTDMTISIQVSTESLVSGAVPYSAMVDYVSRFVVEPEDASNVSAILGAENELVVLTSEPLAEGGYLLIPQE